MFQISLNYEVCAKESCRECQARINCDTKAIVKIDSDEPAGIEHARCNGCGDCIPHCPPRAIKLINQ